MYYYDFPARTLIIHFLHIKELSSEVLFKYDLAFLRVQRIFTGVEAYAVYAGVVENCQNEENGEVGIAPE